MSGYMGIAISRRRRACCRSDELDCNDLSEVLSRLPSIFVDELQEVRARYRAISYVFLEKSDIVIVFDLRIDIAHQTTDNRIILKSGSEDCDDVRYVSDVGGKKLERHICSIEAGLIGKTYGCNVRKLCETGRGP